MKAVRVLVIAVILASLSLPLYAQFLPQPPNTGLQVTFTTNKERYEPGEPVSMMITLRNNSSRNLNYEIGGGPGYDIWIVTPTGTEVWRYSKTRSFPPKQELKLAPGESRSFAEVWNQADGQSKQVPAGWYQVYAKFSVSEQNTEPSRCTIRIDERLATGPIVLLVPLSAGVINPSTDVGSPVSVEGILRQGPQGLYLEVRNVQVKR